MRSPSQGEGKPGDTMGRHRQKSRYWQAARIGRDVRGREASREGEAKRKHQWCSRPITNSNNNSNNKNTNTNSTVETKHSATKGCT